MVISKLLNYFPSLLFCWALVINVYSQDELVNANQEYSEIDSEAYLYYRLPSIESDLINHQKGNFTDFDLTPFNIKVPGDIGSSIRGYIVVRKDQQTNYYYREEFPKEKIVLNYTTGNLKSDTETLTQPNSYSSVPFIIGRDGTVYRLFNSNYWSSFLGKGILGGNVEQSKKSIGIELSNYGPLVERNGYLETIYSRVPNQRYGKASPAEIYCSLTDTSAYIHLDTPFKGHAYFASFSDAQYESLIKLLRYLTYTYQIPREFLNENIRYSSNLRTVSFKGIVSHINFQALGTSDIGPAFDWDRVIEGVTSTFSIPEEYTTIEDRRPETERSRDKNRMPPPPQGAGSKNNDSPTAVTEDSTNDRITPSEEIVYNISDFERIDRENAILAYRKQVEDYARRMIDAQRNKFTISRTKSSIDNELAIAKGTDRLQELDLINRKLKAERLWKYYDNRINQLNKDINSLKEEIRLLEVR